MSATLHSNDSLVSLPDLGMPAYRAIVAHMQAEQPSERVRIGRSLNVLLGCEIRDAEMVGVYFIQSCQDSGTYYRCTSYWCSCPDRARNTVACKHSYAITLLHAAAAQAAAQAMEDRFWLTEKAEQALAAHVGSHRQPPAAWGSRPTLPAASVP